MGGQDKQDDPEVPDLDLPVSRSAPKASSPTRAPSSGAAAKPPPAPSDSMGDFGGLAVERGGGMPMASPTHHAPSKQIVIDTGGAGGDLGFGGMEIERGGGNSFIPPRTSSGPPSGGRAGSVVPANAAGSGLELSYRRADAERRPRYAGPSTPVKILAYVVPGVIAAGAIAALVKFAHRPGRSVVGLLPHAFDASSTAQSGGVALGALVLAIAVGWIGVKSHPRSYAMIASAAMMLVTSLAMVTVTLVSTEENATADGALLIPYVVPAALLLLGLGLGGRGPTLFSAGGTRRAATILVAAAGGALVFAAVELTAIATRLLSR
jgi:hypothetical protein